MRSIIGLFVLSHFVSLPAFAQSEQKLEVLQALECSSSELRDCKPVALNNLTIHNLNGFDPVTVTFDVEGRPAVSLPMPPGKELTQCKRFDLPGVSKQSIHHENGFFVSEQAITWGRNPGKPFEYTVYEEIKLSIGFWHREDGEVIIEYLHETSCSPEKPEAIRYQIIGKMI